VILERLQLQHFRNYRRLDLKLAPGSTLLYGPNGAGKTNVVEAVFTLATTKSFRARTDRELIDRTLDPSDVPFAFARLQGDAADGGSRAVRVEVLIASGDESRSGEGGTTRKQFRLNGVPRRAGDVVGQIKAVLFSPSDVEIVTAAPSARRRYLDLMLCQVDHTYLRLLQSYGRIVQQRNGVLTRLGGRSQQAVLDIWDDKLIAEGSEITRRRALATSSLATIAREMYGTLSGGAEDLALAYAPSVGTFVEAPGAVADVAQSGSIDDVFRRLLERESRRGADQRVTSVGPHRDDLTLLIDGVSLLAFGSRGQQRTAALALRMAEAKYINERTRQQPILLLDEALGELDDGRRAHLLGFVGDYPQVILTGASRDAFPADFIDASSVLQVRAGEIVT